MSQINDRPTRNVCSVRNQGGFSVIEMMVVIVVMMIVMGAVFALIRDSMKASATTYELTDAQENLRTSHEFISRDLMNAGDGLGSISNIRVPNGFVTNYLTLNPVTTPSTPGIINLGIFTSDNGVPANTPVTGSVPATTLRAGTDRQTILSIDPDFLAIGLGAAAINSTGSTITIPAGPQLGDFTPGDIYFLTSTVGATFGTVTSMNSGARQLFFANGDPYGLNLVGTGGNIRTISGAGTLATSLQRMRIIQYYVTSTGLLMRRVFGIPGAGFRDSIISEHVFDVKFNYSLVTTDDSGVVTPSSTTSLTSSAQQLAVRQVEVRIAVETPHSLQDGVRHLITMTTSTSVRNMQFRQAL